MSWIAAMIASMSRCILNRLSIPDRSAAIGVLVGGFAAALIGGCDSRQPPTLPPGANAADVVVGDSNAAGLPDPNTVQFAGSVESNRQEDDSIVNLRFVDTEGRSVRLDQYLGEQNVLLVFTRGFSGQLCPYCTTQTSRLIANYDKFLERNTEVLLVYPGPKDQLEAFRRSSTAKAEAKDFPFPVLLDEDLAAVKRLDIAAQLAHPSTFIIDQDGSVKLSYVGKNPVDRPSIQALLDQLDRLSQ